MTALLTRRQGKPSHRKQRWGMALAIVLLGALAFTVSGVFPLRQILLTQEQVDRSRAQYDALVTENQSLEDEIAALQTDTELERIAREEYGLVAPGQVGYVVVPGTEEGPEVTEPSVRLGESRPWWQRAWDFLTGGDLSGDG